ncbi:family 2 glycosyltransferase [Cryphonectria parasitica EP155]|uniref:chitin synthase n=1 Tax=Cryphonectria parasitica (strain ATCC 38755 / EP155) TaxID=660469 RepID=A0A9P4Y7W4_CRYP1|nr:family 2 glycosyltransferase [Cryphonectria parasitica EP155]KAF3768173.1 family 2 glycosyltransferase [Cryphonectria parasitica EP155]
MAVHWAVKDIVYTAIVGLVMLAALLEWFLWIGAFMYCLWKVFRKSEHWTVNILAVLISVGFLLLSQIVRYWPDEMVSVLMWFAFWSFAGLLTIPWLFCVYYLVTHQLGRTKRIKQLLDEDSAPKVVIVMPCYKEDLDVLITAVNSVVESDYPPSCIHVFLSFDGDQEDELYLNCIERLGVPLTLESYPKSIDVAYKDARITVSRFPHGGKRNCQKATFKLIDRVYNEYLKRNDNLFILFIDSDCILDRVCLQNFLYDMEFSPGNRRNMLAMTGVITSTTKKHSILTLLQDMEYIHGQLFERTVESGCGSVTCLPGALTMLRFSAFRRMAKYYFADKAETCEDLFDFAKDHLGEDRYLTHLFMIGAKKRYQIQMCTSAFCKTEAVQTYKSLVKQRRRWFLGFITNEACMLTDWRLWRRYPVLVAYRFFQNTIRTTALLFFIMVLALLSTEKSINDLPVGFIAISLGLNWLMMIYFGAKLRRYKIWLYPMMFVLNPFLNWYYMVYGIFTAGQRTWGGPRADAGAADKNTTVQEAIEHAEQTGDDLNVVPETFIPAVIAQREEHAVKRSVLQPPPQVEGLFAAPQRTAGGFYRYLDPAGDSSGSGDFSSTVTGGGDELQLQQQQRGQARRRRTDEEEEGVPLAPLKKDSGVDRLWRDSDEESTMRSTNTQGTYARAKGYTPVMAPYRDEPSSPVYMPSGAPAQVGSEELPFMSEEDRRKYEMAHANQVSTYMTTRAQTTRPRPRHQTTQQRQQQGRTYDDNLLRTADSSSDMETVAMQEAGYAETLPGTPVNALGMGGTTPTRAEFGFEVEGGGASPPSSAGGSSAERERRDGQQSLLMPPSTGGDPRSRRSGRGRSPLSRETFVRVPFEDDEEAQDEDEEDGEEGEGEPLDPGGLASTGRGR